MFLFCLFLVTHQRTLKLRQEAPQRSEAVICEIFFNLIFFFLYINDSPVSGVCKDLHAAMN